MIFCHFVILWCGGVGLPSFGEDRLRNRFVFLFISAINLIDEIQIELDT